MIDAVVLDDQACFWVKQVSPSSAIEQFRLNLRQRQACLDQQPTQPSLHGRFSGRCQRGKRTESRSAWTTIHGLGVQRKSGRVGEAFADRHVDDDECLDRRTLQAHSGECVVEGCSAKGSDRDDVIRRDFTMAHEEPIACSGPRGCGHDDLNWVGRHEIKAKQPGRGRASKDGLGWQQASPCGQSEPRIFGQLGPAIELSPEALPGLALQCTQRKPSVARLIQCEGPQFQFGWNTWSPGHACRMRFARHFANPPC